MPSPNPAFWRIVLGFALTMLTPVGLLVGLVMLARAAAPDALGGIAQLGNGATPLAALAMLCTIIASLPVLAVVLRALHHVPLTWLFAAGPQRWRWFFAAIALVLAVQLAMLALPGGQDVQQNIALPLWLVWLAPALLVILLQSATEELIFRGYLQRMLRARFVALWPAFLIPSLLFGLGHYTPHIYGQNAWLVVAVTALWGLILAHLTWQCGSILPAIGIHFANNCVAILLMSSTMQMSGLALFVAPLDPNDIAATRAMLLQTGLMQLSLYALYQLGRAQYRKPARDRASTVLHSPPPPSI
ncbi:MAG: type II CAAX endopeptidase family protein [Paracoccaceae bacterium]